MTITTSFKNLFTSWLSYFSMNTKPKETPYQGNMQSQGKLLFGFYLCILLIAASAKENNKEESPCSCILRGRVYNLAPLASSDGSPRFEKDVKGWNFAYNPCIPFSTKDHRCRNVAVCRWDNDGKTHTALAYQSDVQCQFEQEMEELVFQEPNKPSSNKIRVRMKCNPRRRGLYDGRFSVIDDNYNSTILQVEHYCCCPDACPLGQPLPSETTPVVQGYPYTVMGLAIGLAVFFLITIVLGGSTKRLRRRCRIYERQLARAQSANSGDHEGRYGSFRSEGK